MKKMRRWTPMMFWDELQDGETIDSTEALVAISIRALLYAETVSNFHNAILSGDGRAIWQFVETDGGVLRRITTG